MSLWDTRWNQRHSMPRIRLLQPSKHNQAKSEIRLHFGSVFGMWRIYHGVIPTIWFLFATLNRFSGAIQPENGNYLTTGRGGRKNFKAFGAIASFAYRFPPVFKWEGRREGGRGPLAQVLIDPALVKTIKEMQKEKEKKNNKKIKWKLLVMNHLIHQILARKHWRLRGIRCHHAGGPPVAKESSWSRIPRNVTFSWIFFISIFCLIQIKIW